MRRIMTTLVMAALLSAACSDDGPTGPSPLEPGTPPTTTPPGGTNAVPQVAGTYRGSGTAEHVPPGGGGVGPGNIPNEACTDVEQDRTTITIEVPVDPWEVSGTITSNGRLENVEVLEEETDLHAFEVHFSGGFTQALRVNKPQRKRPQRPA